MATVWRSTSKMSHTAEMVALQLATTYIEQQTTFTAVDISF